MAIELSKAQAQIDKKIRSKFQGMMSETDGFNYAMKQSFKDSKKKGYDEDTPGKGMNPDMMDMMSDTAGFQKILEMSKREEEARQENLNKITENERMLME